MLLPAHNAVSLQYRRSCLLHRPPFHAYPYRDFHFSAPSIDYVVGFGFICSTRVRHIGFFFSSNPQYDRGCQYLPLAAGCQGDVHEAASVLFPLVGAALGALWLLLLLDLGGLRLDLACEKWRLVIISPSAAIAWASKTHLHGQDCRELYPS
jgi:hypothetical protein